MGREPEHHADRSAERRTDSFVERAELVGPAGESTGQLLADLAAGETIDVLGYPIHGEMYASIVEKSLVGAVGPSPRQILIVESGARGGARRVVRGAQEAWMADSFEVSLEALPTEAWWFIGEALDAPAWVDPTVRWIRQAIASNSP